MCKRFYEYTWELKRNFDMLRPEIEKYLDNFNNKNFLSSPIESTVEEKSYQTFADIIFIINKSKYH